MLKTRKPWGRVIAGLLSGVLVASASVLGVAVPAQAADYSLSAVATETANERVDVAVTATGFGEIPLLPGQQQRSFYLALIAEGTPLSAIGQGGSIPNIAVEVDAQGAAAGTLTETAANLDRSKTYEVIAWPSRSNPTDANLYGRTAVSIDWDALFPAPEPEPTVKSIAAVATVTANTGIDVAVTGSGFADVPLLPGQQQRSLYIALIAEGTSLSSIGQDTAVPNTSVSVAADGTFSGVLAQTAANLDRSKTYEVIAWPSRSNPTDQNLYGRTAVSIDWDALFPAPETVAPTLTLSKTTGLDPEGETVTVTGSGYDPAQSLYLTVCTDVPLEDVSFAFISDGCTTGAKLISPNPTRPSQVTLNADGTFQTTLLVAPKNGSTAVYTIADHTAMNNRTQDAKVAVSFAQPEPEPIDGPTVTVSPTTPLNTGVENTLTVTGTGFVGAGAASGAYVLFGETSVWSGGSALPSDGWISQAWVRASEIVDGAFTVSLTVPAGTLDASKSYQVATSAAHALSATDRTLDTFTPVAVEAPAAPTVSILNGGATVVQGGTLEAVVAGLEPGAVVAAEVHSDPVALGSFTADALGMARVNWAVPADFATGAHRLVILSGGAEIAGVDLTVLAAPAPLVTEATPAEASCVARSVSGATLQWGVKESFRSYITGPIAKGSVSGGWGAGSGSYSTETDRGRVGYTGAMSYTGHNGLLDVTLSNPRIQVNGSGSATLILAVQSKGYAGSPDVNSSSVAFANLSLPTPASSDGRISWSGASATLTAAGAEAFAGFYQAGDALDAVSFSFPLGAEVECDASTAAAGSLAVTGGETSPSVLWLGIGMLVLGAGAVALRRRTQRV